MRLPADRRARLLVLALVLSVAGSLWRWFDPYDARVTVDTTEYARVAYAYDGHSEQASYADGVALRCDYWHQVRAAPSGLNPQLPVPLRLERSSCRGAPIRESTVNKGYESIFDARPGYPALVAALLPITGRTAFPIVALLVSVLTGMALGVLCLLVGASGFGMYAGIAALYTLPTGLWMTRLAPEGGMYLGLLTSAIGVVLALRRRSMRLACSLAAAGVALTFAFKSADAVAIAVGTTLALVALGVVRRSMAAVRWPVVAALLGPAVVLTLVAGVLGAPSFTTSLDDTFSAHFTRPIPTDPWHRLLVVDLGMLRRFGLFAWPWLQLLLVVLAAVVLISFAGRLAAPILGFVVVGAVVTLAHPVTSELTRLMAPTWIAVAAAVALIATRCEHSTVWRRP